MKSTSSGLIAKVSDSFFNWALTAVFLRECAILRHVGLGSTQCDLDHTGKGE